MEPKQNIAPIPSVATVRAVGERCPEVISEIAPMVVAS